MINIFTSYMLRGRISTTFFFWMFTMNPSYQQNEPLIYFTYVYKHDTTVRFQYLTKEEIVALKASGAIEVDIKNFSFQGDSND